MNVLMKNHPTLIPFSLVSSRKTLGGREHTEGVKLHQTSCLFYSKTKRFVSTRRRKLAFSHQRRKQETHSTPVGHSGAASLRFYFI
jgi:hypothetical protein